MNPRRQQIRRYYRVRLATARLLNSALICLLGLAAGVIFVTILHLKFCGPDQAPAAKSAPGPIPKTTHG